MSKKFTLKLETSQTYFTVLFPTKLRYKNLHVDNLIRKFLKSELTAMKYDNRYRRWIPQYTYYLSTSQWYRLPIAYFSRLCERLGQNDIKYSVSKHAAIIPNKLNTSPAHGWQPRPNQLGPLKFLSNNNRTQAALSLATGNGKTFTAIRSAINLNQTTLILCTGLIEVWYNSILEQTNCSKDSIWVMQGFDKVNTLNSMVDKGYQPKFVIASLPTMHNFIMRKKKYQYVDYTFSELIDKIGFGTKIIDECHQRLSQMVIIDLVANIKNNIYLSATYLATDKVIRKIFDSIFNHSIKYIGKGNAKHCEIEKYHYHILVSEKKCKTLSGYSHVKYEQQLLERKTLWAAFEESLLVPIITSRFIPDRKPFHRGLIFCSTHDMCDKVVESLNVNFKELNIARYCSSKGDKIDDTLYNDKVDICVTTPGSSGTGKDISNLWFILNTISFSSALMGIQMMGRLRELKGYKTRFIDMTNNYMESHVRHIQQRDIIWKELGLSYVEYNIP